MELICESHELDKYLTELNAVDYSNSVIRENYLNLSIHHKHILKRQNLLLSL